MTLKDEFKSYAQARSFRIRSNYLWYRAKELVGGIWLQKSNWSDTYYVEMGLVEAEFMERDYPPITACWGTSIRAGSLPCAHQKIFVRVELEEPPYNLEELRDGIAWCVDYVKRFADDPELVRDIVLRRVVPEHPEFWASPWFGNHLSDWASGKLGRPEQYFPCLPPYFRRD